MLKRQKQKKCHISHLGVSTVTDHNIVIFKEFDYFNIIPNFNATRIVQGAPKYLPTKSPNCLNLDPIALHIPTHICICVYPCVHV